MKGWCQGKEELAKYKVYPKLQVYNVFNIAAQTNFEQTRPEMFEKHKVQATGQVQQQGDLKSHPAIDLMIDENLFLCPINQVKGDKAYYSPVNDHIDPPLFREHGARPGRRRRRAHGQKDSR